ncbi:hypothetical protein DGG96_17390 [Legionella qingyii]|uniref:Uncharacterized protein n=1 Tax=Legionella qingyii TaxID=2184757 RepID=A0A317U1K7_9GAMM|nr:hypothetical protein DGG96_17390 [Legionella qingyii]
MYELLSGLFFDKTNVFGLVLYGLMYVMFIISEVKEEKNEKVVYYLDDFFRTGIFSIVVGV